MIAAETRKNGAARRAVSLLLALVLCLTCMVTVAYADSESGPYTQGYFKYYLTKDSAGHIVYLRISEYFGREESVKVPSYIATYRVDEVDAGAFAGTAVTQVTLDYAIKFDVPEGIEVIRTGYPPQTPAPQETDPGTEGGSQGGTVIVPSSGTEQVDDPGVTVTVLPFTDVRETDWFYGSVSYCYANGLMNGVSDTSFSPNTVVSRAMMVTVLWRLAGSPKTGNATFTDLVKDSWYYDAVQWAFANGIVNGYNETTFAPDQALTREQMAAIFFRFANYRGMSVTARDAMSAYTDRGQISGYALDAMGWCVAKGLINGISAELLSPNGTATRAQLAAVLQRFCGI